MGSQDTTTGGGGSALSPALIEMVMVESRVRERLFGEAKAEITIGRFTVLEAAGAGGMGVVFAAHDPKLNRKVAIKLVAHAQSRTVEHSQGRLLAEAQTLARLSHPNIVTVHDVGTFQGRVYIAMEFIEGETLERWASRARSSWSAILDAFVQAGNGLAAAHRAGVVHRDFKPTNAMIDRAGRVRVLDFGLAIDEEQRRELETTAGSDERPLTAAGGTPQYMAPEQTAGAPATALTDQYSFCVSLWNALYGTHPSHSPGIPAHSRVPAWLRRALQRGLAPTPEQRWPNMQALLDTLTVGRARAQRRRLLMLTGLGALAVGTFFAARTVDARRRTAACEDAGAEVVAIWNDDARDALRTGMLASNVQYAELSADKAMPWIDAQAEALHQARVETCLDTDVRRIWDADMRDRSLWCLDERQMELEALIGEMTRTDGRIAQNAVVAAASLQPAAPCRDENVLQRSSAPPQSDRVRARELRAQLAHASVLERSGEFVEGLEAVRSLLEPAEAIDWPPLWAAVKLRECSLLERTGAYEEAEDAGMEAYFAGAKLGAWDIADAAAIRLVFIVGSRLSRFEDGLIWNRHAEMTAELAGDPTGMRKAYRLHSLANVYAIAAKHLEARRLHEQALEIRERVLGPHHPSLGTELTFLADTYVFERNFERAAELHERALEIEESTLGPGSPHVVQTLNNYAVMWLEAGETAKAKVLLERALPLAEAVGIPMVTGHILNSLANVASREGDRARAREMYERALAMAEGKLGTLHFSLAPVLYNLGTLDLEDGKHAEALARFERVLAVELATLGPEHVSVAEDHTAVAEVLLELDRPAEARTHLVKAISIFDAETTMHESAPRARFALARSMIAMDGDHALALAEAQAARAGYLSLGDAKAEDRAEIDDWIARLSRR